MAKVTMNSLPPELTPEEIAELEAAEKMLDLALNDAEMLKKCM